MTCIDAHHHVWRLSRGDYAWLTPGLSLYRDYTLDDLRPLLGDVVATVLVQAAPTEAETLYMLDVARRSSGLVRGVVGWIDFAADDAPARVAVMRRAPLLKGLRPMLQDIAESGWILQDKMQPAITAMIENELRFDALIQPRHLPVLLQLCNRYPELQIVIDHAAKPAIGTGDWQPWADDIAKVARETQAFCKLSGLVTEARADWHLDDLRRYVEHIILCFGPERLMWGSDWPVVNLAGGYARWREATSALLAELSEFDRAKIMFETSAKFYSITNH